MRHLLLAAITFSGGLFAQSQQSQAEAIFSATKDIPPADTPLFARVLSKVIPQTNNPIPTQNIFTTVAPFISEPVFVPCFNCVTGAVGPTIGLATPDVNVVADGVTLYVLTNYFADNSYSGTCDVEYLVRDAAGKYIFRLVGTLTAAPGESIISGAEVTLPNNAAFAGPGAALTIIRCGSTAGLSEMQVDITNP